MNTTTLIKALDFLWWRAAGVCLMVSPWLMIDFAGDERGSYYSRIRIATLFGLALATIYWRIDKQAKVIADLQKLIPVNPPAPNPDGKFEST